MRGLMQDRPLALPHVFHRAEQLFGHKPIVTATAKGEVATTVADWAVRVRRLATALDSLGVPADGRVGTFMWNTASHLELYLAAPCTGRVLHTLNIRLFPEQQVYIANHAEDDVVFVDRSLLPVFLPLRPQLHTVRHVVVIDDGADHPLPDDALDYDELLAGAEPFEGRFEIDDENSAAAMCYTSGTTGNPKGVVYSHRSTLLHSLITLTADGLGLSERDVLMPVVPMFHVNAWGLPYAGAAGRVEHGVPRPEHDPEGRTRAAGAPPGHRHRGRADDLAGRAALLKDYDLSAVQRILCGGSAVPRALSEAYRTGGRADPARLGDDRDLAGGDGRELADAGRRAGRRRTGRRAGAAGPADTARGAARDRSGDRRDRAERRRDERRDPGGRPVDRLAVLPRRERRHAVHRRRLAPHRRRCDRRPLRLGEDRRPHEGPREVRRRVDQLGGAGERDHGAPEGGWRRP